MVIKKYWEILTDRFGEKNPEKDPVKDEEATDRKKKRIRD